MRLVAPVLLLLAACTPGVSPGPSYTHADGRAAIEQAFADHGPHVVARFQCIAGRESGHWPYATNGRYKGLTQIDSTNAGYQGSLRAAAQTLGRAADWFDPYVNARTARIIFDYRTGRGLDPYSVWSTARYC